MKAPFNTHLGSESLPSGEMTFQIPFGNTFDIPLMDTLHELLHWNISCLKETTDSPSPLQQNLTRFHSPKELELAKKTCESLNRRPGRTISRYFKFNGVDVTNMSGKPQNRKTSPTSPRVWVVYYLPSPNFLGSLGCQHDPRVDHVSTRKLCTVDLEMNSPSTWRGRMGGFNPAQRS